MFAGFEMYSILRGAKCRTVAQVQSLAASAASTIMSGCEVVMMSPVAQIMLHLPATVTDGDRNAHQNGARMLDGIKESILNGYELRCRGKTTRAQLDQLMNAESWLTAQDAVDLGLADGILYQEEGDGGVLPQNVVNAVGGGIRSLAGNAGAGATREALLARYEQLVRNGAKPADGHGVVNPPAPADPSDPAGGEPDPVSDDWQRKARLAIENNRFL